MVVRNLADIVAEGDIVLPFKIYVSSNSKCYFCGRNKKEITAILQRMSEKIEDGIRKLEAQIDDLTKQYLKQEKKVRNDLKNVDLSLRVQTVLTDLARFKKDIPHLDLLINGVYSNWNHVHRTNSRPGAGGLVRKAIVSIPAQRDLNEGTLENLLDGLSAYLEFMKDIESKKFQTELERAKLVYESYYRLEILPLVNMASKPLGAQPARRGIQRDNTVQFNLTVCHFCFDRFQGSTL